MRGTGNIQKLIAKLLPLVASLLLVCPVYSQQDPVYSQYMNNLQSMNPGYTGVRGVGSVSSISRKQWLGLDGAPTTSSLTFSLPIDSTNVSLGLDLLYDYTLPEGTLGLFANYAYRIQATPTTKISFGLKAGFNYMQATLTDLYRHDPDDPYIAEYGDFRRWMPNVGVGVFWYGSNFYAGFAAPRLLQNRYNDKQNLVYNASREERHYFIQGAYMFPIAEKVVFKPGITTIMVAGAPITSDFDFSFLFNNRIWFGAMYRISDAIGAYAQFQVNNNFKLGFAYDFTHTRLQEHQNGTFEILLRWDFKTKDTQFFPRYDF